jgi:hypothetical protein
MADSRPSVVALPGGIGLMAIPRMATLGYSRAERMRCRVTSSLETTHERRRKVDTRPRTIAGRGRLHRNAVVSVVSGSPRPGRVRQLHSYHLRALE